MRSITHGPLATLDTTATLGEFVAPEHLMHLVPGEAIGRRHQDACQGGHRGPVSESVKTGPLERGAAGAVSAIDVLLHHMPIRWERHVGVQAAEWLRNRLMLGRTTGRDTPGESAWHGMPPDAAMVQGYALRSVPSPMAEGTGMPKPTVVHRHVVLGLSGVHASLWAWVPPAYGQYGTQANTPTTASAAEPQGTSPPRQLELTPPGAAEFVICDHTIETFYQDGKMHLGLDEYRMRNAEAIGKHWCLVFVAYSLLHTCLPMQYG